MHSKIFMYFLILNLLMIKTSLANQAGLPQLNFETYPSLIFWSVLSLITLYLLMSRLVTPKVSEVLNFREQNIQNNLCCTNRQQLFRHEEITMLRAMIAIHWKIWHVQCREILSQATGSMKILEWKIMQQ